MKPEYEGPQDVLVGYGEDVEFGHDPERTATLEIEGPDTTFQDANALVARSIADMMRGGATLANAAAAIGQSPETLRTNTKARAVLKDLLRQYELDADEMKQLVKVTAVQMALEGEGKEKLDAAKLIAQMPEVGLTSAYTRVNVAVGVFSDETNKVLASIDPNEGQ